MKVHKKRFIEVIPELERERSAGKLVIFTSGPCDWWAAEDIDVFETDLSEASDSQR